MSDTATIKLNLGASQTRIPGFVNIDIVGKADISMDLGKDRLPFENDSVDVVFSHHTLEHISDYLFCVSEVYRVLKNGGHFLIGVPYVTLTEYNLVNPYHLHNFNEFSFDFFDPDILKGSASEENPVHFKKVFHRFHYMGKFALLPLPIQNWCRRHLLNVVREIDFGLVTVKSPKDIPQIDPQTMIVEYTEYLQSRIPY